MELDFDLCHECYSITEPFLGSVFSQVSGHYKVEDATKSYKSDHFQFIEWQWFLSTEFTLQSMKAILYCFRTIGLNNEAKPTESLIANDQS